MSIVYKTIIRPKKIAFASRGLVLLEAVLLMILTSKTHNALVVISALAVLHIIAIRITAKEPHIDNILRNAFQQAQEAIGQKDPKSPRYKTPLLYKDDTKGYFDV